MDLRFGDGGACGSTPAPAGFTYSDLPPEVTSAPAVGFLQQESYFCCTRAGSDVTAPSSSSGPGSSLDPEILRSFPVVLGDMGEVRSRDRGGGGLRGEEV